MKFSVSDPSPWMFFPLAAWTLITVFIWVVIHIIFAYVVYKESIHRKTVFFGPMLWALVTLFTGLLGATVFWVMHISRIASKENSVIHKPKKSGRRITAGSILDND